MIQSNGYSPIVNRYFKSIGFYNALFFLLWGDFKNTTIVSHLQKRLFGIWHMSLFRIHIKRQRTFKELCKRFPIYIFWSVEILICGGFGFLSLALSSFRFLDVSLCRRFVQPHFWLVDVSICWRFRMSTFWLSKFWFVDILTSNIATLVMLSVA